MPFNFRPAAYPLARNSGVAPSPSKGETGSAKKPLDGPQWTLRLAPPSIGRLSGTVLGDGGVYNKGTQFAQGPRHGSRSLWDCYATVPSGHLSATLPFVGAPTGNLLLA